VKAIGGVDVVDGGLVSPMFICSVAFERNLLCLFSIALLIWEVIFSVIDNAGVGFVVVRVVAC